MDVTNFSYSIYRYRGVERTLDARYTKSKKKKGLQTCMVKVHNIVNGERTMVLKLHL